MNDEIALNKSLESLFCQHTLTTRERETASFLIEGFCNDRIANMMHLSTATVKGYLTSIYRKFHVESRT